MLNWLVFASIKLKISKIYIEESCFPALPNSRWMTPCSQRALNYETLTWKNPHSETVFRCIWRHILETIVDEWVRNVTFWNSIGWVLTYLLKLVQSFIVGKITIFLLLFFHLLIIIASISLEPKLGIFCVLMVKK
jgi:hypothetical protein